MQLSHVTPLLVLIQMHFRIMYTWSIKDYIKNLSIIVIDFGTESKR